MDATNDYAHSVMAPSPDDRTAMSYPPPVVPGQPQQPHPGMPYAQPAPKRRGPLVWILGCAVGVVLVLCVAFVALGAFLDDGDSNDAVLPAPTATAAVKAGAKAPTPADFKLTAKVTDQKCYGEAGCAVTWLPEIVYTGPALTSSWLVSYTVEGVESGTKAGTIVMGETGPAKQREKRNRVADEDTKVTLKVTGVERG
jgi:hypothetical protein